MTWALFGKLFSSGKGAGILAGVLAGVGGFGIAELFADRWLAGIIGGICLVLVAFIKTRPRMIEAESTAAMGVVERMDKLHHDQIKFYHERMTQQNKLIAILTITKHAFATENNSLRRHCELRGELLSDAGIEFPQIAPKDFGALVRAEDVARSEIAGLPPSLIDSIHGGPAE